MSTETHSFEDGKYTLINNNGILTALRHGEPWPAGTAALVGDGLTLAMFHACDELAIKAAYLDRLLPQVTAITDYLSTNSLGTWGADSLPCALELIKKHVPLPGKFIELPSQPVQDLATRVAQAVFSDEAEEGCDNQIGIGLPGPRFSALIVEMAGHEAEAYALQDQVDEANSSVTALEQRVAELETLLLHIRDTTAGPAHREQIIAALADK